MFVDVADPLAGSYALALKEYDQLGYSAVFRLNENGDAMSVPSNVAPM